MTTRTTIPHEALRQHAGILGTTGSGKTYAARKCLEWLLAAAPILFPGGLR